MTGLLTIDLAVASMISKALSAILFSVSRVGFTSAISQAHTLGLFANSTFTILASSTVRPFGTGVPVPVEKRESMLSTSKET